MDQQKQQDAPITPATLEALSALAESWRRSGMSAFRSAENYPAGTFGRRFIEHGAMCYANCYMALTEAIQPVEPLAISEQLDEHTTHDQIGAAARASLVRALARDTSINALPTLLSDAEAAAIAERLAESRRGVE